MFLTSCSFFLILDPTSNPIEGENEGKFSCCRISLTFWFSTPVFSLSWLIPNQRSLGGKKANLIVPWVGFIFPRPLFVISVSLLLSKAFLVPVPYIIPDSSCVSQKFHNIKTYISDALFLIPSIERKKMKKEICFFPLCTPLPSSSPRFPEQHLCPSWSLHIHALILCQGAPVHTPPPEWQVTHFSLTAHHALLFFFPAFKIFTYLRRGCVPNEEEVLTKGKK